jgi:hypothetical protein
MAVWLQEAVAAVSMLMFVGSVLVLAVAGQVLLA